MSNNIETFLEQRGELLDTGEYVLSKENALKYIDLLDDNIFIFGGDIYKKDEEGFYPTYENWYVKTDAYSLSESQDYAKRFISNYKDNDSYFVIVV